MTKSSSKEKSTHHNRHHHHRHHHHHRRGSKARDHSRTRSRSKDQRNSPQNTTILSRRDHRDRSPPRSLRNDRTRDDAKSSRPDKKIKASTSTPSNNGRHLVNASLLGSSSENASAIGRRRSTHRESKRLTDGLVAVSSDEEDYELGSSAWDEDEGEEAERLASGEARDLEEDEEGEEDDDVERIMLMSGGGSVSSTYHHRHDTLKGSRDTGEIEEEEMLSDTDSRSTPTSKGSAIPGQGVTETG
ncbi:unnamed protein product [Protopolystoma xenopodis]|uniref:Uncharacterized protein n=1 Tax=Protopolystoma xenopodis TaxID=117903 RepID=A0A3S5CP27_9PLAT|nr:unnamed protein product [Protopolystoma xenopodis]